MAGILKSKVATYAFTLEDMSKLIAADLQVPVEKIAVHYTIQEVGGDPMDRYRGTDTVTGITVTVKE